MKDYYPEDLQKFVEDPSDLQDDYEYPRNGTDPGLVVIFNHERFENLDLRKGSRRDVNELIQSLGRVGYNIEKQHIHNDLTRREIMQVLKERKVTGNRSRFLSNSFSFGGGSQRAQLLDSGVPEPRRRRQQTLRQRRLHHHHGSLGVLCGMSDPSKQAQTVRLSGIPVTHS